jgi:hypothetical protein
MLIFTSLEAATREGFSWQYFNNEYGLHVVELDRKSPSGRREKALAFARPALQELAYSTT